MTTRRLSSLVARKWTKSHIPTQVKVESSLKGTPSSVLHLRNLPISIIPDDIRRLDSETTPTEIILARNSNLKFGGNAIVRFKSSGDAIKFSNSARLAHIGTVRPVVSFVNREDEALQPDKVRHDLIANDAGRMVLITGLPGKATTHTMKRYLEMIQARLEPAPAGKSHGDPIIKLDPVGRDLQSKFLVRLVNTSEAYRIVRALHNTFFRKDVYGDVYFLTAQVMH